MTTVEGVRGPTDDPGRSYSSDSDGPPLRRVADGTRDGRTFERPVAWLLGRQLMGSIKGILLYAAYGKKLDPRDWMTAEDFEFDPEKDAALAEEIKRKGGFWFDYISDTGDGMKATYSLAYLCMSDLYLPALDPARVRAGQSVESESATGLEELPRGAFLLVGGDTAYHASDYMTLAKRVQQTFNWAFEDLADAGRLSDHRPRPVFGIPGNHDYYDQLDGFRRQFRRPADRRLAQLHLHGFRRAQRASYFALRLPFGWTLWGLDTEVGQIDERQKQFFRRFCLKEERGGDEVITPPERLIVATCSPTTTFGKLADPEDYKAADAFGQLGIEQPFLPKDVEGSRRDDGTYDLTETGDARLRPGQCRLDLSGDVHHYARYWGPPPPAGSIEPRVGEGSDAPKAERPASESYSSVVSGIGGAFHHPSQTYVDEVREQSLYPSEARSTGEVAHTIFKFWNIWGGGYVWLAGLIAAFVIYFAFSVPQSSREFINNLPHFGLGLAQSTQIRPTVFPDPNENKNAETSGAGKQETSTVKSAGGGGESSKTEEIRSRWRKWLGLRGVFIPPENWIPPDPCQPDSPRYFFGPCRVPAPWDFWVGIFIALFASVPLIFATFRKGLYEKEGMEPPGAVETAKAGDTVGADAKPSSRVVTPDGDEIKPAKVDPEIFGEPDRALWTLAALASLMFFGGLLLVSPYNNHITPFGNSLLVLLSVIWAVACVALSLRYSEFLFKKSHRDQIHNADWLLPGLLSAAAVVSVAFGLWAFGQNNKAALLVADALFVLVVLALLIGLIVLPFKVGATLLSNCGATTRFLGKLLIGLWHFALQIAVPFLLVRKASLLLFIAAALVVAVGTWAGGALLKRFSRAGLAVTWFLLGALTLALPFIIQRLGLGDSLLTQQWFAGAEWLGWKGLWASVVAGAVGAVMCCYWFGWYLGVCFVFNGHNNEVGGAARIERFKEFIRFRLDEGGLTGYVIAVNDPEEDGRKLTPHVVDVFRLRPKGT